MTDRRDNAIAIVGLGAILPDAPSATAFWTNLCEKRYSISDVRPERWAAEDYYDPDPAAPDKTYTKIGGWVRGFSFDWKRFHIPPRVAAAMDEGQQWAVTVAADTLADYGYPQRPLDLERTGVILGTAMGGELHYLTHLRIMFPEFARALSSVDEFRDLPRQVRDAILSRWHEALDSRLPPITEDSMPGELPNIVSGRVANVLNLRGPNFITDAACASSFAAIDAAAELLVEHHCDAVIAGGVDRNMGASTFVKFCKIGALSATGTRPFGDGADGFVMGEGTGLFLLKRLADAERAGDRVYAVLRGVGESSDGKGKGITAPNPVGQKLAVMRAWQDAGLDPATATLLEAHGTSTKVGDVVEVESLTEVFREAGAGRIALGSAKSNIGHLKAGAGAAGLLKAVLALHHRMLPPTLNAERPNPSIDFTRTPFVVNHDLREWTKSNGAPRRAGVSAYGFGGTNFHLVLEEHVPGALTGGERARATVADAAGTNGHAPLRGMAAIGAPTPAALKERVEQLIARVRDGHTPPIACPDPRDRSAHERLVIDFGDHGELLDRLQKAERALGFDTAPAWKALRAQGIFRGTGPATGKTAFLFPGQGSQYVNMGRDLFAREPVVAGTFAEADRAMTPLLGRPLTSVVFASSDDQAAIESAEQALMQTAVTQPAVLTVDAALARLLGTYGFQPDYVMGHSLGEYAALVAAGAMPFADALEASAARGREMTRVSLDDNGWMAAVMAPLAEVERTLKEIDGYVVAANINGHGQAVIGGASKAVEKAIERFTTKGFEAVRLPVSHAFHTSIVAPASGALRAVLQRLRITAPRIPLVSNVTGGLYPSTPGEIVDLLVRQIASPVQWVKGVETLYAEGVRVFVEAGPKKALKGLVDDVLAGRTDVVSLHTNHPKTGELASFNHALCGLYAAGVGVTADRPVEIRSADSAGLAGSRATGHERQAAPAASSPALAPPAGPSMSGESTSTRWQATAATPAAAQAFEALTRRLEDALKATVSGRRPNPHDRNEVPQGSIVISGTGLGLPGAEKAIMDPANAERILRGEQFIDLVPERFRTEMARKRVTRVVKGEDGSGRFETVEDTDEVLKLAGRPGTFDFAAEYGVSEKLVEALDGTTQLAMAAGLDALREAGIPLVQTWRRTTTGKHLPDRWMLPESLRDETGVIFAGAFPGLDRFAGEARRYYTTLARQRERETLEDLRQTTRDPDALREIQRRLVRIDEEIAREPYSLDRRFLLRVLPMGHSQFAEYVGARGPNTAVNAACASTALAVGLAEDWIRAGRCRRVVVVGADVATSDNLLEWVGAGFLATGAAATDDKVAEAALPFDRRRHGTILGMGACGLVVESQDAVEERGMRGIVEVLSTEARNSAFHATRLDVDHVATVMESLVTSAERRFGLNRRALAPSTVFMSHETYTPARGGSASAEVAALRKVFGSAAREIVVANTKGFTGHPMGVGVEDVIAVKVLEHGIVPPVPNLREIDPELGALTLSRGGRYPVEYAIHLAAGFGSQIAMTFVRHVPGGIDRLDDRARYDRWLADVSGYDRASCAVVKRVLRIPSQGAPNRPPAPSAWQFGLGPTRRVPVAAPPAATFFRDGVGAPTPAFSPAPALMVPPAEPRRILEEPAAPAPSRPAAGPPPTFASAPAATPTPAAPLEPSRASDAPSVPAPPSAATASGAATDFVKQKVMAIVAEKTGYPPDMLDADLDLEADLGVDTVKQAETFAAVREAFAIPRVENLKLRDFPTLAHVIGFVYQHRPELLVAAGAPDGTREGPVAEASVAPETPGVQAAPSVDPAIAQVLAIVAEKTGYPSDMLELDLDLEADLGVDTVKQAETFAAVREAFAIPRVENLKLRDFPTLRHVVGFVHQHRPDLLSGSPAAPGMPAAAREGPASGPTAVSIASPGPDAGTGSAGPAQDAVTTTVLAIVAEKTGYPSDMLELDLDLEADLGVDTVKQAETFAAVREAFAIPRVENLKLRDFPTLRHVVGFVHHHRPDLLAPAGLPTVVQPPEGASRPGATAPSPGPRVPSPEPGVAVAGHLEDADRVPRRVVVPTLRPSIDLCKATGVVLADPARVVVMSDEDGVALALNARLGSRGVTVLSLEPGLTTEQISTRVTGWLAEGPISGVYWLPALDVEPAIDTIDLAAFRELNRRRVKALYAVTRDLDTSFGVRGTFLVAGTRMGGYHGYGADGATAPLGGSVSGFVKACKRERPEVTAKVVDFEPSAAAEAIADALIEETLADPGAIEIGRRDALRWSVAMEERPAADGGRGLTLDRETVFVVTGAAGGITSAIVADLAAHSGGTFHLLDLVAAPARDDAHVAAFRADRGQLKLSLIDEARTRGERPTPVQIERQLMAIERADSALRAIDAVERAGGTAVYTPVDLLDGAAVARVVAEIGARHGRIDVLVHAGGIEVSKALAEKDAAEFDRVFDIKADGFFSLLEGARGVPIGATVVFSSVAGRFGNAGQTDYSAANALLCALSRNMRLTRPATRAIAIDWTAWAGIGMATRGSIPAIMEAAGIETLPPEVGIPTIRRELTAGGAADEIVVGGRLGVLTDEWDDTGGLDVERASAWLASADPPLVMVGSITAARLHRGFEVATRLDPSTQPFLFDHQIEDTPVLPGVMGTEAFAEVASVLCPGRVVSSVEDVAFLLPFKFHRRQPATIRIEARGVPAADGRLAVRVALKSRLQPKPELPVQERVHFTATVVVAREIADRPAVSFARPGTRDFGVSEDAIYRLYFHGPAYKVLERARLDEARAVGLMAADLPPDASPARAASLVSPRLIELCFQTAGLLEVRNREMLGLPTSLRRVAVFRHQEQAKGRRLYAEVWGGERPEEYDARVVDDNGDVYVELQGYRTVALPGKRTLA